MIKTQHYIGLMERQALIKTWEAQGYRMTEDTFDNPKWIEGMPIAGTMIFDNAPEVIVPPSIDPDIAAFAAGTTAQKLDIIAKRLGLK